MRVEVALCGTLLIAGVAVWLMSPSGETAPETRLRQRVEIRAAEGPTIRDPGSLRDVRDTRRTLTEFQSPAGCVVAFLGVDCPLANRYVPRLLELYEEYAPRGMEFVAVYPHEHETVNDIAAHALERGIAFPVLKDHDQALADELGVTRTPEFCLLGPNLELLYRGRFDDQYGITNRAQPTTSELTLAIEQAHAGRTIAVAETPVDGCLLSRDTSAIAISDDTYGDIAPILEQRCVLCHQEGGQAPFPLTTFDDAVRWAPMIREVVVDRRMPPWHADPRFGEFHNDRRLTPEELDRLVAWIDAGLPRQADDPLAIAVDDTSKWSIGEPDVVIDSPEEFSIPAQGTIEYQYAIVPREISDRLFSEDRWLQAGQMMPSSRDVTHHMNLFFCQPPESIADPTPTDMLQHMMQLIVWAPGSTTFAPPDGTAMWIPRGTRVMFECHYTPSGRATRDRPSAGLVFASSPPETGIRTVMDSDLTFAIPPHDPHYQFESSFRVPSDVRLLAIAPHMHLRGKASTHRAILPDGTQETLLSVPRWDFEWHTIYWFDQPLELPAGTRLHTTGVWDNSRHNPANPDPDVRVLFGQQSSDEMLAPIYWFEIDDPVEHRDELFITTGAGQESDGMGGFTSRED